MEIGVQGFRLGIFSDDLKAVFADLEVTVVPANGVCNYDGLHN